MKIDKKNGNVNYCDETHTYWKDGTNEKYISVTTLIGRFEADFDKEFWSKYKGLERLLGKEKFKLEKSKLLKTKRFDNSILATYDITEAEFNKTVQDILDEWDKKNRESCERGTKIHAQLEAYAKGGKFKEKIVPNLGRDFNDYKCYVNPDTNELVKSIDRGILPEYLVYRESDDGILKLAGQIDLLIKDGNDIWVADYKGLPLDTEIPTENGWKTMQTLKVGDKVFDMDGNLCNVLVKSEVHNNPCYKIVFAKNHTITADCDHKWLVYFKTHPNTKYHGNPREVIMTTKELYEHMQNHDMKNGYNIPKIKLAKCLQIENKSLPLDPYILGLWLGDGTNSDGSITQEIGSGVWDIIRSKGFDVGDNKDYRENGSENRTVYGLISYLKKVGVYKNKHIPDEYLLSSFTQRLDLLRGLMDADGYYDKAHNQCIMRTHYQWQAEGMLKLVNSLGVKATLNINTINNGFKKGVTAYDIKFKLSKFNPFLCRNQNIELSTDSIKNSYYNIKSIEKVETIPTQCIMVDSPTHTYLCTNRLLITHNTNAEIKMKAGFNSTSKSEVKMKYPLNNIPDANYWHYTLQLSTYAWMLQKVNPDFNIKGLILIHFDHEGNITTYQLDYLKDDVERMLAYYKTMRKKEIAQERRKRIEF